MKIEAWLSENEKEERAGEQLQRKAKQLQANRRSFEDSGTIFFHFFMFLTYFCMHNINYDYL